MPVVPPLDRDRQRLFFQKFEFRLLDRSGLSSDLLVQAGNPVRPLRGAFSGSLASAASSSVFGWTLKSSFDFNFPTKLLKI